MTAGQLLIDTKLQQFERDCEATPILPPASWARFRRMPAIEEATSTSQTRVAALQGPQRPPSRRSLRCDRPTLAPATGRPSLRVVTANLCGQCPYDLTPIAVTAIKSQAKSIMNTMREGGNGSAKGITQMQKQVKALTTSNFISSLAIKPPSRPPRSHFLPSALEDKRQERQDTPIEPRQTWTKRSSDDNKEGCESGIIWEQEYI